MLSKNDLRIAKRIKKELAEIDRKLGRKRRAKKGQERAELEALQQSLKADLFEAELWLDELFFTLSDIRTRDIFMEVFINGMKQREAAKEWNLSEQRICAIIREGLVEINEKAPPDLAAP